MAGDSSSSFNEPSEVAEALIEQAEELCPIHNHITRVIGDLDIPEQGFSDRYTKSNPDGFGFVAMIRTFLYQEVCEFSQREVYRRIQQWPYIQLRFDLKRAPTQQTLSHTYRNRLSLDDRQSLQQAVEEIRGLAIEHDLLSGPRDGPDIEPHEVRNGGPTEDQLMQVTKTARDRVFSEFSTRRASNAKYDDSVIWELQGYLSLVEHGGRETKRRVTRTSWRNEMPHKDTHTRTVKKMGAPEAQTELSEFEDSYGIQHWERIRKTLLNPFHNAIENLIAETDFENSLREPVNVAIDITPWQFYPSPWIDKDRDIVKEDYPEMVSGYSKSSKPGVDRGYKFATLTVVGENTPIVLAIEPIRENSNWEPDGIPSMSKADAVERLLAKASDHVDINKVMLDRGFDSHEVRDVIDRREMIYLIPKRKNANQDFENIQEIEEKSRDRHGVEHDVEITANGRTHNADYLYVPADSNPESLVIFTTNADVPLERVRGLTGQYRDRWMIENQYKCIKEHFLPRTTSSDYRVRLFYFISAVLMYNVWRLTNLLLSTWYDVNLGNKPPIPAGEVSELLIHCSDCSGVG